MSSRLLIALILLLSSNAWSSTTTPRSPELERSQNQLFSLAEQFYTESEFYRAITEYRRLLHYFPESNLNEISKLRIAQSYFFGGEYLEVLDWVRTIEDQDKSKSYEYDRLELYVGKSYLKLENYPSAEKHLIIADSLSRDPTVSSEALYELGQAYTELGLWDRAKKTFLSVPQNTAFADPASRAAKLVIKGHELRYKSPRLAGFLNVVPGVGYAYAGKPQTGISAFLLNALFFSGTYSAFKGGRNGVGVLVGVIGFGWYTGGIYGATVATHRWNFQAREKLIDEVLAR
jgi:tetratricopeptide (TPR) repeat protein